MNIPDTEYMKVRYVADRFNPVVKVRRIEKRRVGSWLFGLLPVYEYFYSDWSEE